MDLRIWSDVHVDSQSTIVAQIVRPYRIFPLQTWSSLGDMLDHEDDEFDKEIVWFLANNNITISLMRTYKILGRPESTSHFTLVQTLFCIEFPIDNPSNNEGLGL